MNDSPQPKTVEQIWRQYDAMEQRLSEPLTRRMIELAGLVTGMRVLDLGTGRGEPAIPAAKKVGPTGEVVGVDVAESMLAMAKTRADHEGVSNLRLITGNGEELVELASQSFDAALARWCLMYFAQPQRSLAAVHRLLKPNSRLVVAVWTDPDGDNYFSVPRKILGRLAPASPVDRNAPGTFFYADDCKLHGDLEQAGFTIEVSEDFPIDVMEAATGEDFVAWHRAFGLNRLLKDLSAEVQQAWEAGLKAYGESIRKDGWIRLGGVTRIVVATA